MTCSGTLDLEDLDTLNTQSQCTAPKVGLRISWINSNPIPQKIYQQH